MSIIEPQFLYMILILPGLFGITLIGEGIYKLFDEERTGFVSILFGLAALVIVFVAYEIFRTVKVP